MLGSYRQQGQGREVGQKATVLAVRMFGGIEF